MGLQHSVVKPDRIAALRTNNAGYPVPYFVADPSPDPDFRVASQAAFRLAVTANKCWVCGQRRPGGSDAFVLGPMCAVTRVTAEPPSHPTCAQYSVQVCPFLTRPDMRRRENGLDHTVIAGEPILRNPGVALVWVCTQWAVTRLPGGGYLFDLGDPDDTSWWTAGRPATRGEVLASLESGLPQLQALCDGETDRDTALKELDVLYQRALTLLPSL